MSRRIWPWLVGACSLGAIGTAHADPARRDSAEDLFERGKELVVQKRYDEACPLLARSREIDPGIGTLLWLGECWEKSGRIASAWRAFDEAAASAAKRSDERERVARRRAVSLEAQLTRLVIVVPPSATVEGLEIRRDGARLEAAEIGVSVPVDPGTRTIAASAPGRKPWTATIELPARPDVVSIEVPALEPAEQPRPAAPPPSPVPPPVHAEAPPPSPPPIPIQVEASPPASAPTSWMRVSGVALGVVGLGLVGVGTFFGLEAKSTYDGSNANGHCVDNACDGAGKALRSDATSSATLSTVAFGAGAAAVVAGVVLYVLAPTSTPRVGASGSRMAWSVTPAGGARDAGVVVTHRW